MMQTEGKPTGAKTREDTEDKNDWMEAGEKCEMCRYSTV